MAEFEVWPHRLLRPKTIGWSISGGSIDGGRPLGGGASQLAVFGGGGLFVARLSEIAIRTREAQMAWLALEAALDNGATPIVVSRCSMRTSPLLRSGHGGVPHSDGTPFSDDTLYAGATVASVTTQPAAFRATSLSFTLLGGRPLIGGEHFSINHPTAGWRIYRVFRIVSLAPVAGGFSYSVQFRCPLREAVDAGVTIEWDLPRCLMRLADPDGMALDEELLKFASPSVSFVEDDYPEPEE